MESKVRPRKVSEKVGNPQSRLKIKRLSLDHPVTRFRKAIRTSMTVLLKPVRSRRFLIVNMIMRMTHLSAKI